MEAAGAPQDSAARGAKRSGSHSGRLLLRMPERLHGDLARASERAGVSLNSYINDVLAAAVGSRPETSKASRPKARSRALERLLVVNLLVLSAVGVLAVVLLVQALR
jgi:hypothetical protein